MKRFQSIAALGVFALVVVVPIAVSVKVTLVDKEKVEYATQGALAVGQAVAARSSKTTITLVAVGDTATLEVRRWSATTETAFSVVLEPGHTTVMDAGLRCEWWRGWSGFGECRTRTMQLVYSPDRSAVRWELLPP